MTFSEKKNRMGFVDVEMLKSGGNGSNTTIKKNKNKQKKTQKTSEFAFCKQGRREVWGLGKSLRMKMANG